MRKSVSVFSPVLSAALLVCALLLPLHAAAEGQNMKIARETDAFTLSVKYPVLGVDGVDADMARWAENLVREFERDVAESGRDPESAPYSLEVDYEVERPSPDFASVTFFIWSYLGGAHGIMGVVVQNYDLRNSLPVSFPLIFEDTEAALQLMSTFAHEALRMELGDNVMEEMLKAGTTPDMDNFSALSLRPGGVRLHFPPYQVAPWSAGRLYVDMPLEALADARPHLELWGKE